MNTPNMFLAYAPRGVGLRCAVVYLASGRDAYGWFTGPRLDLVVASRYFLLEDFYSAGPVRYEEVDLAELHSGWSLSEPRRRGRSERQVRAPRGVVQAAAQLDVLLPRLRARHAARARQALAARVRDGSRRNNRCGKYRRSRARRSRGRALS